MVWKLLNAKVLYNASYFQLNSLLGVWKCGQMVSRVRILRRYHLIVNG